MRDQVWSRGRDLEVNCFVFNRNFFSKGKVYLNSEGQKLQFFSIEFYVFCVFLLWENCSINCYAQINRYLLSGRLPYELLMKLTKQTLQLFDTRRGQEGEIWRSIALLVAQPISSKQINTEFKIKMSIFSKKVLLRKIPNQKKKKLSKNSLFNFARPGGTKRGKVLGQLLHLTI